MAGDQDQFLAVVEPGDVVAGILQDIDLFICQGLIALKLVHDHVQRVDDGIACHKYLTVSVFLLEILLAERSRREIVCGNTPGNLAVHLLRPRAIDIVCAQTRFNVSNWNLLVECRQRRRRAGGGIAMDKHNIGLCFLEDIPHPNQHSRSHVIQVLPLLHYIEIIIRLHFEYPQHLVQHLPMLPRHAHDGPKVLRILLELLHQRTHLNRLRPGPEY